MSTAGTDYRAITAAISVICALGCVCAIWPVVETAVNTGLLVLGTAALLAAALRRAGRWVRERREDRADERAGRAWWAAQRHEHRAASRLVEPFGRTG